MPQRASIDNMPAGLGEGVAVSTNRVLIDNWPAGIADGSQARSSFIGQVLAITGDTRLLFLPDAADTTTSTDQSLNALTITHSSTIATRLSRLGIGYSISMNGTTNNSTLADSNLHSFGTGAADSAFSVFSLVRVTDSAARRVLVGKSDSAVGNEWTFEVSATDFLSLILNDNGVPTSAARVANAVITHAAWRFFVGTYSAATGGATAANDMALYTNGLVTASTATNSGTYVAMENLTPGLSLGSRLTSAAPSLAMAGDEALHGLCQKALSASEVWALYQHVKGYFGI
jgi:hypothetical protein